MIKPVKPMSEKAMALKKQRIERGRELCKGFNSNKTAETIHKPSPPATTPIPDPKPKRKTYSGEILELIKHGDYSPLDHMLVQYYKAMPFNKGRKGRKIFEEFCSKHPDRATDSFLKILNMKPEYANKKEIPHGTTNIQFILDGLGYSQKEKLLIQTLKEVGLTRNQLENICKEKEGKPEQPEPEPKPEPEPDKPDNKPDSQPVKEPLISKQKQQNRCW